MQLLAAQTPWLWKESPRTPRSPSENQWCCGSVRKEAAYTGAGTPLCQIQAAPYGERTTGLENRGLASVTWQGTRLQHPLLASCCQREGPGLQSGQERGPKSSTLGFGGISGWVRLPLVVMDAEAPVTERWRRGAAPGEPGPPGARDGSGGNLGGNLELGPYGICVFKNQILGVRALYISFL